MHSAVLAIAAAMFVADCAASRQEVAARLGAEYIGQNVDVLVRQYGPPANTFKMTSGETSYHWQLGNQTNINMDRGVATGATLYCKISVLADAKGTIKDLATEDQTRVRKSIRRQVRPAASAPKGSASPAAETTRRQERTVKDNSIAIVGLVAFATWLYVILPLLYITWSSLSQNTFMGLDSTAWTAIGAMANIVYCALTGGLLVFAYRQIRAVRADAKINRTLAACERYDIDPVLDNVARRLSDTDVVRKCPKEYKVDLESMFNY